jgi:hypothetical protein
MNNIKQDINEDFIQKNFGITINSDQMKLIEHNMKHCNNPDYLKSSPEDNYDLEEFLKFLSQSESNI